VRVAHVVSQFHPGKGELGGIVLALSKQQRLEGVNAEVVTLNRLFADPSAKLRRHDSVEGVPVHRIPFLGASGYPIAPEVLSCIEPFDIVHVHGDDFFCDYLAATQLLHRKPLVLTPHRVAETGFAGFLQAVFFHTIRRMLVRRYARVFASGDYNERRLRSVAGRRLRRIDNGADAEKFADLASRRYAPTLVYFGRFASDRGLDDLIEAFDIVCDELPRARLHLMGSDWDSLVPALEQRIANVRYGSAITIHLDPSEDEIRRVIAKSCFFATASRHEASALPLIAALAAGLVPIVSRISSFSRVLEGIGAGLLVDFRNGSNAGREMAAFVLETALRYRSERTKSIELATQYSWPKVARRIIRQYEDILGWRDRKIFGVRIRPMSRKRAVSEIDRAFAAKERLNVSFANAHSLNIASANEPFRAALQNFLVLNDGLGVDLASRFKFGRAFAANLNGTDFIPDFLALTRHRLRIYLVGATDAAVLKAAESLRLRYPRHTIVGSHNGYFAGIDDIEDTCRNIRAARADCVFVGMGNPLQELWIDEYGGETGANLLFAVGARFDFQAETVRRAPTWIRNLRCEWVFRLLQEPRRLAHRYLVGNILFLSRVLVDGQS
jgi:alpha-1,3-mannosyltransferase